jgi:hypothetical protein
VAVFSFEQDAITNAKRMKIEKGFSTGLSIKDE